MSDDELAGTTWTLVQFETDSGVIPAVAEAPATLSFTANDSDGSANRGLGMVAATAISAAIRWLGIA